MGDTPEMVRQARILAQATSQLVNALKSQAESHPDSEMQKKLLAAAKMLADATARMVEAAKVHHQLKHKISIFVQQFKKQICISLSEYVNLQPCCTFQGCASSPQDARHHDALKSAAEELRSATNTAATSAMKRKLIKRLEAAAKQAASSATQLINASQAATKYNTNTASQTTLMQQCKVLVVLL